MRNFDKSANKLPEHSHINKEAIKYQGKNCTCNNTRILNRLKGPECFTTKLGF